MNKDVLVVIGVGGMGEAIARRQGAGKLVLLADFNEPTLHAAAESMQGDGYRVTAQQVDVSSHKSVTGLAQAAATLGSVAQVAHTAGVSAALSSAAAILKVNLLGVALVLEEFGRVIAPGGAGLVIASMAGQLMAPLTTAQEQALAQTPADGLLELPFASPDHVTDPRAAYAFSKRANQAR